MEITRNGVSTTKGPADWFTGEVHLDTVAVPRGSARVQANLVRFTPGARTAWHTHALGQSLYVIDGVGLCQRRGGPIEVIRPGDRVFIDAGEDHWHGAPPNRFMVHLAINETDEEHPVADWGDHVSGEEYDAAPTLES